MDTRVIAAAAVLMLSAIIAEAQTVQLPTFHQFGISTTVSVPDRGSTSLGGVRRSATGSNQFGAPGLPGNRSGGAGIQGGGVGVSAQIHDFDAMDQDLRQEAAGMRGSDPRRGKAVAQENGRRNATNDSVVPSLAEIRRQKAAQKSIDDEVRSLMARGEEALAAGRLGTAQIYFQMVARRAKGPLHDQAIAKYDQCKAGDRGSASTRRDNSVAKVE
jgi:hypothetical protein